MTKKYKWIQLGLAVLVASLTVPAQARNWTGNINDDWGDPGNWFPLGLPLIEPVEFPASASSTSPDLNASRTVLSASFSGGLNYSITEGVSGSSLTLAGGDLAATGTGSHRLQHVTLDADGTWSIDNPQIEVDGDLTGPRLTKTGSGILLLTGGTSGDPSTLETLRSEAGEVIISGEDGGGRIDLTSPTFTLGRAAMSTDGGDITIQNGADVRMPTSTDAFGFINNSTLTVTGSGTSLVGYRLDVAELSSHSGSMVIKSGASVDLAKILYSGYFGAGDISVESGADVSADRVCIGIESTSSSSLSVKGSGSQLTGRDELFLGGFDSSNRGGTGVLTITDSGLAQAAETKFWSSSSSIIVNGGTLVTDTLGEHSGVTGSISLSDPAGGTALTLGTDDGSSSFAGVIQNAAGGAGSITKVGSGTFTPSGINSYSGGTALNGGSVSVSADSNLGATSGPLSFDSGTLKYSSFFSMSANRAISLGAGGGTIDTGNYNPSISSDITGTGPLTKTGNGGLALAGDCTYSGGTLVNAGTLLIGGGGTSGSISGNVTNNASLAFDRSDNMTFGGTISGIGDVTKYGAASLTLTATNTYSGGTLIDDGTLRIGNGGTSGSISGDVTNNASLAFNRSNNISFGGTISGSGTITKYGAGTLTLTGDNTYTGGTYIADGTIHITNDAGLGASEGDITFLGGTLKTTAGFASARSFITTVSEDARFETSGGILNLTGGISGPGGMIKSGSGPLNMSQSSNTYSGDTVVLEGALDIGGGGEIIPDASNLILENRLRVYNGIYETVGSLAGSGDVLFSGTGSVLAVGFNGTDSVYSGELKQSGGDASLVKIGAGTLTLENGNSDYTEGTVISNGTLLVNNTSGSATGSGFVNALNGGTLGGTGSVVGDVNIDSGATLAPGASAGTFIASSSVTLNGTYQCEIDGATADKLVVGGALDISSGTLDIDLLSGGATEEVYIIATYGSLTGSAFASVTDLPAGYKVDYAYNGNQIALVALSPFELWTDSYDLNGTNALFDADPDSDGGKNGYEWATGTIPTNPASITMLGIGIVTSDAVVSFTRNTNATDMAIYLQRSLDLMTNVWSGIATNTAGSWTPPGIITETGSGNPVDVEINDSQTNRPAAFYRLKVE